eukprot:CAMPEP_0118687844 /NCGR_PEP_ID=MMETSP0800-20121206/8603_1 /TAXON_ID=210618 ORGANISM="Striatella unipunctata, Strain CCMP2910" /NCGR_SAMPLE_ID=MMETSP0800 /ASSEMBLY_ACC=CAM_ASM_000638 /LENGTH=294 /DNA_ID=CAMNT_0006585063 /DNA_START=101 /DNA_END=985 /DNA_ORIENTATION=-
MSSLSKRYFARMGYYSSQLLTQKERPFDFSFLCELTEAHLGTIPFENLAQHGGKGGPVKLDIESIAEKVLDRRRGGFCLELNTLFGELLRELDYKVTKIPSIVYKGEFDHPATHVTLIVTIESTKYMVDVGFGESPIHPLEYVFDKEQITPEGMKSRIVRQGDEDVVLEWFKDGEWQPRLLWKLEPSLQMQTGPHQPEDWQGLLDLVYDPGTNFSNKLIVCKVTREKKLTLSGSKLKCTVPRFGSESKLTVRELSTLEEVRQILKDEYGIAESETEQVDIGKIKEQDPSLFAGF